MLEKHHCLMHLPALMLMLAIGVVSLLKKGRAIKKEKWSFN